MRHVTTGLLLCVLALPAAGCTTGGSMMNMALLPSGAGASALGDGLVGQARGVELSAEARRIALDAEFQALQFGPVGRPVVWQADGYRGEVTPTQLYRVGSQDCRGYTLSLVRGGQTIREVGSACRTQDDRWALV